MNERVVERIGDGTSPHRTLLTRKMLGKSSIILRKRRSIE
jgi:hypothetical protein